MPRPGALLISHAADVPPRAQRQRERALLAGAARGEIHLHASTLPGAVLGLGAFHRALRPTGDEATACWRRHTGGCAVTCGEGFAIVTITLPHRAALVADDRLALRPEQVMNRCVRGLLTGFRRQGLDAAYPGLDAVTVRRRTIARLGFVEARAGTTLFQAIVACSGSFTETPALADRLDPAGRVPVRLQARDEVTSLAELGRPAGGLLDLASLARELGDAYAATFPTAIGEVVEVAPGGAEGLAIEDLGAAPDVDGAAVVANGVLGQVAVVARVAAGRVSDFALTGDFLAPPWAVTELAERVRQVDAKPDPVRAVVREIFDGSRGYLLGLAPAALEALLVQSITEAG